MCIWGGRGILMAIRIGRGRVGMAMVDGGGCDGIEKLDYGGRLVGMRVLEAPIHHCQG
jgi:hypothetical protein